MHAIAELKKKQVGFRMPTYLLNKVDKVIDKYEVNRSEFLNEATRRYLQKIQEEEVYERLGEAMQEVKLAMDGKIQLKSARLTIEELKNELKDS
ncbi:hypothetical protein SPBRAN_334 [uncultured Candidatus Thioglobus sp.]|nr:hypothetical protein SPBRAN_334 [uncultured Candidatus Thioglobus sp.]